MCCTYNDAYIYIYLCMCPFRFVLHRFIVFLAQSQTPSTIADKVRRQSVRRREFQEIIATRDTADTHSLRYRSGGMTEFSQRTQQIHPF